MVKKLAADMKDNDFDTEFGDKSFCLIDSDIDIIKNEQILKADRIAKNEKINLIVSSPCFEIWFICHFLYTTKQYCSSEEVVIELQKHIPTYSKNSDNLYDLLIDKTTVAIKNAKKLEQELIKNGQRIHTVQFMPSTEVYHIIEYIKKFQ